MRWQVEQTLQRAWTHRGWLALLLLPLSWLYGTLAWLHRQLYRFGIFRTHRVNVPVVVVGNIVVGGSGKTPTVIALVQHLQAQGVKVGVISRGYGRNNTACIEVKRDSLVSEVGDETASMLLAFDAPIFVANKRFDAASKLLQSYPETQIIVSDDGLQHHALHHDMAITVFNERGMGNGFLLPAGPLREARIRTHTALDNTLILHTHRQANKLPTITIPQFNATRTLAAHAVCADGHPIDLLTMNQAPYQPLIALAGVANPGAFFEMLREHGLHLNKTLALPDHYDFDSYKPNKYAGYSIICTIKDAVKLWHTHPNAYAVPLILTPEPAFFTAFDTLLATVLHHKKLSLPHGH